MAAGVESQGSSLGLDFNYILYAIAEKGRWEVRRESYKQYLDELPADLRNERKKELKKIEDQIKYYDKLIMEMKHTMRGSDISAIMKKL